MNSNMFVAGAGAANRGKDFDLLAGIDEEKGSKAPRKDISTDKSRDT